MTEKSLHLHKHINGKDKTTYSVYVSHTSDISRLIEANLHNTQTMKGTIDQSYIHLFSVKHGHKYDKILFTQLKCTLQH